MSKTLILYSTTDGQTKRICEYIKKWLKNRTVIDVIELKNNLNIPVKTYDEIIIGASIRYGKHKKEVFDFINKNKLILDKKNNAFFTVNVVARKSEKNTPTTNPYMKKFLDTVDWKPNKLEVFSGRIDYPNYRFFDKQIIRLIMFLTKGPTNTSESYEFTDWSRIKMFAESLNCD